jgi:hypothetical protein
MGAQQFLPLNIEDNDNFTLKWYMYLSQYSETLVTHFHSMVTFNRTACTIHSRECARLLL